MNPFEQQILTYLNNGFKKEKEKTLKFGSRIFLRKRKGIFGIDEGVYIYFVDGNASTDSIRECLKDYEKLYQEEDNYGKKGIFLCSGTCDKKTFNSWKNDLIEKDKIRKTIKLISLGKSEESENDQPSKVVEKEKPNKEDKRKTVEISEVLTKIKNFPIHKRPNSEKNLESMLVSYLCAFYPDDIETQITYHKSRIDAQIGSDVGIEIKYQPSSNDYNTLYGQVENYLKHFEKVIVVIGYERTRELTDNFRKRVKERGWLNNSVYVISIG